MVIGILLSLAAAIAAALALFLQASDASEAPPEQSGRISLLLGLARRPRWVGGTLLLLLAWPLQVAALTRAPITVVQPALASFQLWLLVISRRAEHVRIRRTEIGAALSMVAGVAAIVAAAPRRTSHDGHPARLAITLAAVAVATVVVFVVWRARPERTLLPRIGAGLAYAWVDFADKLVANAVSDGHVVVAVAWVAAVATFGGLAFLQETSALQLRAPTEVAPVIAAFQEPLPIIMALAAGAEAWQPHAGVLAALIAGVGLVGAGAIVLARADLSDYSARAALPEAAEPAVASSAPGSQSASSPSG